MQGTATVSIVYRLTMEDLIAHNLFQFRHSSTVRRMQRRSLLFTLPVAFLCALGTPLVTGLMPFWPSLGTAVVCSVAVRGYFLYDKKRGYIKRVRKLVQQMYAENKHPGLLGEHTLEVNEEGITHVGKYSRTSYAWGALQRIESEPGYTYLFLGELAFIIRHENIILGDFKTF